LLARVIRQRRLKQIVPAADQEGVAVDSRADCVLDLVRRTKDFVRYGVQLEFGLKRAGHGIGVQRVAEPPFRGFPARGAPWRHYREPEYRRLYDARNFPSTHCTSFPK